MPATDDTSATARAQLTAHLSSQLGQWPPTQPLVLTTSAMRQQPGWDGVVRRFFGVRDTHAAVLSVPGDLLQQALRMSDGAQDFEDAREVLEKLLGGRLGEAVFRWSEELVDVEPLGQWVDVQDPAVPEWLHPFGGDALLALDDEGNYLAGVGLKRHDDHAWEIAVGTEEHTRGKGLARRLVATASRYVQERGLVPLYFHALDNVASARVADAAGFPDRGWRLLFVLPQHKPDET